MPAGLMLTEDPQLAEDLAFSDDQAGFAPTVEVVEGVTDEYVEGLAAIEAVEGLFPPELIELAVALVRLALAAPPGVSQSYSYSGAQTVSRPNPVPGTPGTLTWRLPTPLEAVGEPENSLDVAFVIADALYAPLLVQFAILQGIVGNSPSVPGADSPDQLSVSFSILASGDALNVSFDVVPGALTAARSKDVQMPTASVQVVK